MEQNISGPDKSKNYIHYFYAKLNEVTIEFFVVSRKREQLQYVYVYTTEVICMKRITEISVWFRANEKDLSRERERERSTNVNMLLSKCIQYTHYTLHTYILCVFICVSMCMAAAAYVWLSIRSGKRFNLDQIVVVFSCVCLFFSM